MPSWFHASAPAAIDMVAFNPPLGVYPEMSRPQPTLLAIKEGIMSFSGDDFYVKDQNGQTVVKCKGKAMSMRERKVITDPTGKVLFNIHTKMISIHTTYEGEDANGKDVLKIQKKMSMGTKLEIKFRNANGEKVELDVKGDFWGGSANITLNDRPVAHISRSLANVREVQFDKQSYAVQVAPGVDLSMIAAACICLDELKEEGKDDN